MNNHGEEAKRNLIMLHKSNDDQHHSFANKEFEIVKAQIDHEVQHHESLLHALKRRSMQKRFLIGWLAMSGTQASALLVVLSKFGLIRHKLCSNMTNSAYQSTIYGSLGFSPFMSEILAASWTVCNGAGNLLGGYIGDYVGRKRQISKLTLERFMPCEF
jgi:hypothetical protein